MNLSEFEGRKRKRKLTQAQIDAEREKNVAKGIKKFGDGNGNVASWEPGKPDGVPSSSKRQPIKDRIADAIERSPVGNFNSGYGGGFHKAKTKKYADGKVTTPTLVRVNGRDEVVDVLKTTTYKTYSNKQKHKGRAR